jgi:hypothetical protein
MSKQDQMLEAYQNPAYGGPLIPDGPGIEVLAPRLHKSPLEQEAKAPPVQFNYLKEKIMKKPHFGFYSLYNIRAAPQVFYDIHILLHVEPSAHQAKLLKSWSRKYQGVPNYDRDESP